MDSRISENDNMQGYFEAVKTHGWDVWLLVRALVNSKLEVQLT